MDTLNATQVASMLREIEIHWLDFVESRLRGTPRVMTMRGPRSLTDDGMVGYGSTPAPLHLDVLDGIAQVVTGASAVMCAVAAALGEPEPEPLAPMADPRESLRYSWARLGTACASQPRLLEAVAELVQRMRDRVLGGLGLLLDGQGLDALCPFCRGVTFEGVARTLKVRTVPARAGLDVDGDTETVLVCENSSGCPTTTAEASMWVRGMPAWPMSEWSWLASQLG